MKIKIPKNYTAVCIVILHIQVLKMTKEKKSYFKRQETWADALEETDEGLVPVAMKLKLLPDEIDYIPDPSYTTDSKFIYGEPPIVAIAMTTVFIDPEYNGKWSYVFLEEKTRQDLAKFVYEEVKQEAWVFLSQHWD